MIKRLLIIEDEEIILELMRRKLIEEGYEVSVARNGEEGLKVMRQTKPNLILLDIVMPKIDGFGVMEEMGKDEDLKGIPVIIISNSGQPVDLDKARDLGAKDWLIKTEFDPQEVVDKVKKQINN